MLDIYICHPCKMVIRSRYRNGQVVFRRYRKGGSTWKWLGKCRNFEGSLFVRYILGQSGYWYINRIERTVIISSRAIKGVSVKRAMSNFYMFVDTLPILGETRSSPKVQGNESILHLERSKLAVDVPLRTAPLYNKTLVTFIRCDRPLSN